MSPKTHTIFWALVILSLFINQVPAETKPKRGSLNLIIENDKFADTDRHYTNGLQLAYFLAPGKEGSWVKKAAQVLPLVKSSGDLRHGIFMGHEIYTPNDTTTSGFLPDQRPYAGWLYGGVSISSNTSSHFDVWRLNLGVVGPAAQGEEVQNNFHRLIGVDEAKGWDHQLSNKFGLMLVYESGYRKTLMSENNLLNIGADIIPHYGFCIGNVEQYLNTGLTLRFGRELGRDYGPPRIRPSLPGSEYFDRYYRPSWYAFFGGGYRYVNRNIFIDGHDETHAYNINREKWVHDIQAGMVLSYKRTRLTYTYVYRSKEFRQQQKADQFASIGIGYLY